MTLTINQALRRPSKCHLWPGGWEWGRLRVESTDNYMSLNLSNLNSFLVRTETTAASSHHSVFWCLTCPSLLSEVPQLLKLLHESEFSFGPEFWLSSPDILAQTLTPILPTLLWKAGVHTWASLSWTGHWHKQNLSKSREKISVLTARSYKLEYFPEMGIAKVLNSV